MKFSITIPHGKPGQQTNYQMIREATLEVEKLGFEGIYIEDHMVPRPNTPYPERDEYELDVPYLECWTLLSALAVETKRVKLGTFTLCNSFRHPPSLMAKMAATLDNISGGRLIYGLGAGYNEREYKMYGLPYPHKSIRLRQLEEALKIVKLMWTEPRPSFKGKYYHIEEAICNPKPLQKPYPPIMVGGRGRKITLAIVARHADIWNWPPAVYVSPEIYTEYLGLLERHCERADRNMNEIRLSMGDVCHIRKSKQELNKEIAKYRPDEVSMKNYMNHLIGTPDECIKRVELYQDLGVSEFVLEVPSLSRGELTDLHLLANEVMPSF